MFSSKHLLHNTSTLKAGILGFTTKGRGSQINGKPEQIYGEINPSRAEKKCDLNTHIVAF